MTQVRHKLRTYRCFVCGEWITEIDGKVKVPCRCVKQENAANRLRV